MCKENKRAPVPEVRMASSATEASSAACRDGRALARDSQVLCGNRDHDRLCRGNPTPRHGNG